MLLANVTWRGQVTVNCRIIQAILHSVNCTGPLPSARTKEEPGHEWWQSLLPYLVAVGAGTAVLLHRILTASAVVLAWAREAGVALGHDVNVHWP